MSTVERPEVPARADEVGTLRNIVSHLAFVEDCWSSHVLRGAPTGEPWGGLDRDADPDADWAHAGGRDLAELDALLVAALAASDRVLDDALAVGGPEQVAVRERYGRAVSLRWILVHLVHLVEEYARHCGHADLVRESIDGSTDL